MNQDDYYKFRKQVTPSGKYAIYSYVRYRPMAFSSGIICKEVFKIDEKFEQGKGQAINGVIGEWLSDDTLLVYNFKSDLKQPKDTLPIKTEYDKLGDFVVKMLNYKSNQAGRAIYDFDSVSTTHDSIFVRVISDKKRTKLLGFPLGGTTITTQSEWITHIEIDGRLHKNMGFILKNADGSFSTGRPGVGTTWYDLTPTKKIGYKGLNARKNFWEEKAERPDGGKPVVIRR